LHNIYLLQERSNLSPPAPTMEAISAPLIRNQPTIEPPPPSPDESPPAAVPPPWKLSSPSTVKITSVTVATGKQPTRSFPTHLRLRWNPTIGLEPQHKLAISDHAYESSITGSKCMIQSPILSWPLGLINIPLARKVKVSKHPHSLPHQESVDRYRVC
jgi:hypothetical protein